MGIGEFFDGQTVAETKRLENHRVISIGPWFDVEQQSRRAGNVVGKTAAHSNGEVEQRIVKPGWLGGRE
jgi:hypothetical protein